MVLFASNYTTPGGRVDAGSRHLTLPTGLAGRRALDVGALCPESGAAYATPIVSLSTSRPTK